MSSTTKPYEEKMNASVDHLVRELASIRAGRANPAVLDRVTVDYYGTANCRQVPFSSGTDKVHPIAAA